MTKQHEQTIHKAISLIKMVPFTRRVILTGSLAEGRGTEKSDIDFFVQVEDGQLYSTRFFITMLLQLAGIRRTDTDIAGKICLNWFATYDAPAAQKGRVYKKLWHEVQPSPSKMICEKILKIWPFLRIESGLKNYQIRRIESDPRTHLPGSQVRYSDKELGFHPPKHIKNVKST
jgi:predicted nucleotidyltransferase